MYICGKAKIDSQGRILLSKFFNLNKEPPKAVYLLVPNAKDKKVLVTCRPDVAEFCTPTPLDGKNRIILPKWIREEVFPKSNEVFFVISPNGQRYLLPKK